MSQRRRDGGGGSGCRAHGNRAADEAQFQQVVARDWWMGGWKQRTCSTVELSVSTAFMYLLRMAKISLLRIWYFLMRSAIFFKGCGNRQRVQKRGVIRVKRVQQMLLTCA